MRGLREGPATEKRRNIMREDWMRYGYLTVLFFSVAHYFLKLHFHHLSKIKSHKEVRKQEE